MVELAEKLETGVDADIAFAFDNGFVACDNGYADQKIVHWSHNNGVREMKEILLPSRAQMGAINISFDGKSTGVYEINNTNWTVGRDVNDPESIRGKEYAVSDLNTVLVNHSLIAAGFGGRSVELATGLPFDHFHKGTDFDEEFIEKVKKSLKAVVSAKGDSKAAKITNHQIFPESVAAFVDHACTDKGIKNWFQKGMEAEGATPLVSGCAIVDIGGNTTDITYINPNITTDRLRSGTKKLGVLDVRTKLKQLILTAYGIDQIRDSQLDNALRTGECNIFGKAEDVSEHIQTAKRESVQKLMNHVSETIGDAADLDFVLFVGGGAEVLGDVIKKYKHAIVPDRPQFANARGMLKRMTFMRVDPKD